mgnify:CR=1 FL=1
MIDIIVPYKKDNEERALNKLKFMDHYNPYYKINLVENYKIRAKAYNESAVNSTADFIALGDIDAIIPYGQINQALFELNNGADIVYPYSNIINLHKDGSETDDWPKGYYYGCMVFFNRKSFLDFGGENEKFIGYGWEDLERYYRALNYGLIINRVQGDCYHLMHPRTGFDNPYFGHNMKLMQQEKNKWISST